MTVDIARVKSDRAYRDTVRRKNAQAFFVVGTVCLLVLIAFVINADVSHVAGWFAIVGIVLIACSFLTQESPISTAIGFVRLYRNGLRTFLPIK